MTIPKPPRQIVLEVGKDGAWAYFDDDPYFYGLGRSALYSESHSIYFRVGLGHQTNYHVQLLALKLIKNKNRVWTGCGPHSDATIMASHCYYIVW